MTLTPSRPMNRPGKHERTVRIVMFIHRYFTKKVFGEYRAWMPAFVL